MPAVRARITDATLRARRLEQAEAGQLAQLAAEGTVPAAGLPAIRKTHRIEPGLVVGLTRHLDRIGAAVAVLPFLHTRELDSVSSDWEPKRHRPGTAHPSWLRRCSTCSWSVPLCRSPALLTHGRHESRYAFSGLCLGRFAVVGGPFASRQGQRPWGRSQVRHTVTTVAMTVVMVASVTMTVRMLSARRGLPGGEFSPSLWGRSVLGSWSCRHHGQSLSELLSQ
ncbi:hypothetical protein ACFC18_44180 [Streptomyces sp. NPDC056121]|uniref:hypothetical protein n=1 Tax=unclassified Streptomyces TaxID=2593676 RepID=UPI0035DF6B58